MRSSCSQLRKQSSKVAPQDDGDGATPARPGGDEPQAHPREPAKHALPGVPDLRRQGPEPHPPEPYATRSCAGRGSSRRRSSGASAPGVVELLLDEERQHLAGLERLHRQADLAAGGGDDEPGVV